MVLLAGEDAALLNLVHKLLSGDSVHEGLVKSMLSSFDYRLEGWVALDLCRLLGWRGQQLLGFLGQPGLELLHLLDLRQLKGGIFGLGIVLLFSAA